MSKLVLGILWGVAGQILSFIQLQVGIRYGWNVKHQWVLLIASVPISYAFIKSVENLILAFDGQIYPNRLIGFGIGIIVFSIMNWMIFREGLTMKTALCIVLGLCIICIQVFWKTN